MAISILILTIASCMLKAQAARSPILLSKFAIEYFTNVLAAVRVSCTAVRPYTHND